jgi:predicted dinucleotide-binding enzyme
MRIGLLGTGRVATAAATDFAAAGHDVVLGSRIPEARKDLDLLVVGLREAAAHGDVVVNASLGTASVDVLGQVGGNRSPARPSSTSRSRSPPR